MNNFTADFIKNTTMDNCSVTLCFPYRGSGGVPMQFLRLSSILVDRGWSVNLIDYDDGAMSKNLRDRRVNIICYDDHGSVTVPADSILVLQTMTPWSIFPGLCVGPSTKMLFWTCHPFNLVPTVPLLCKLIQRGPQIGSLVMLLLLPGLWFSLKRFLRRLIEKKSIVFMDVGTVRNTSAYLREEIVEPTFVPIPAPVVRVGATLNKDNRDRTFRIGWVGRIADFKYSILSYTINRLNEIAPQIDRPLSIDIVGSGDFLAPLLEDMTKMKNLTVRYHGEKSLDDVIKFINSDIDILLAMGTSALEGASYGVPTILLDFSYGDVPSGYNFRWLHERVGYSLGELIGKEYVSSGDDGLKRRIIEVITEKDRLVAEAQDYVHRNHSIERVADRFEKALNESKITWGEIEAMGVLKKSLIYLIYKRFTIRKVIRKKPLL